jgi:hypothetical protein
MPEIRDLVGRVLRETNDAPAAVRIDRLVELVNDEKAKSYGIGFQDGQRRQNNLARW